MADLSPAISDTIPKPEMEDDGEGGDRGRNLSPSDSSDRALSPWPDESNSESESELEIPPAGGVEIRLLEAMKAIDVILGQLARIAVAIRRSGVRSRLQKADSSFKIEEHNELKDHLQAVVLYRPGMSSAEFNKSKPDEVQRRLIKCNLRRRHRFLYMQRHAGELERVRPALKSIERVPKVSHRGELHTQKQGDSASQRSANSPQANTKSITSAQPPLRTRGASEKAGTTASAMSEPVTFAQEPSPSQAAPTQVSATATKIDYPWPPLEAQKGALSFQCPCCCQTLPAMMARGNHWKYAHEK